jgi:hypothetical protein
VIAKIGLPEVVETQTFPAKEVEIFAKALVLCPTGQAGGRTARPPAHRARS